MASQSGSISGKMDNAPNPAGNGLTMFEASEQTLRRAVETVRQKKPDLLKFGPDLSKALSTANVALFSDPDIFTQVAEGVQATAEQRRHGLASKIGSILASLAPLASIVLGVTSFAADAAGVGSFGLVVTGLGAVLAYALQQHERNEAVFAVLNELSYNKRFVVKIVDANKSADQDIVDCCLQLLTELNNSLAQSLTNFSRGRTYKFLKGLVKDKADESDLIAARKRLDEVLQRKVNLIILEESEIQQQSALLKWFSDLDFNAVQTKCQKDACVGCGTWFVECDEVKQFISGRARWLWCEGEAGVGKTNLVSLLVSTLEQEGRISIDAVESSKRALAFVFCDINDQQRQDTETLLRSIVRQVVESNRSDLYRSALAFYEKTPTPSLDDLVTFVSECIPEGTHLWLVIDAVDELAESDRNWFLSTLDDLLAQMPRRLSILTTARIQEGLEGPRVHISTRYDCFLQIKTLAADVKMYVEDRIQKRRPVRFDMDDQVKEAIIHTITSRADNRFILARLQLDSLYQLQPSSPGDLEYDLLNLPLAIDEFYDKAMKMIDNNGNDRDVRRLLLWVLVVPTPLSYTDLESWERRHPTQRRGPLSIQELSDALMLRPDRPAETDWNKITRNSCPIKHIVGWSRGLCSLDEDTNTVRLAHPTVQEYLLARKLTLFPNLETYRCKACLAYLSIDTFQSGACTNEGDWETRVESFPFLEYAARNWCEIRGLTSTWEKINIELEDDHVAFLSQEGLVANLAQVIAYSYGWMKGDRFFIPRTTGLIMAMQFNLLGVMKRLCEAGVDVNAQSDTGQTALDLAVTAYPDYVRLLLRHGAKVTDESGRSALRIAIRGLPHRQLEGGVVIIKMLVENDPTLSDEVRDAVSSQADKVIEIPRRRYRTMMAYRESREEGQFKRLQSLLEEEVLGQMPESRR